MDLCINTSCRLQLVSCSLDDAQDGKFKQKEMRERRNANNGTVKCRLEDSPSFKAKAYQYNLRLELRAPCLGSIAALIQLAIVFLTSSTNFGLLE